MILRTLVLALCLLYLLLRFTASALGHSELQAARPAPGAQLATPPQQIVLTFSQPLSTTSRFTLYRQNFQPVAGITATIDPAKPEQMLATTPNLAPGVYTVQWMAVALDRDLLTGSYNFVIVGHAGHVQHMWLASTVGVTLVTLLVLAGFARQSHK